MKKTSLTCCFCGCLCDDLVVEVENNTIKNIKNACVLGREKLLSINKKRNFTYYIKKEGEKVKVGLEEAIKTAAKMLVESEKPLLYGWSNTSCEAQKIGLKIAEVVKGVWDNTTSVCHGPTSIAVAEGGISTATLGEIKNRADTIIYWGSNPLEAHPRHLHRYTYFSDGRFVHGKNQRRLIVIDVRKTKTAKIADKFIEIKPNSDYQLISLLQLALNTGEIPENNVAGVTSSDLEYLVNTLKNTKFGVIFFGLGLTMSGYGFVNVDALLSLIRQLNKSSKWVAIPMRGHYNVTGANVVATYLSGFPFGIDFSGGYAYYNPGETTTSDLIMENDVDLIMSVAADPIGTLSQDVSSKCLDLKIISVDPFNTITTEVADVVFPTLITGIETSGTAYRMDSVPLPLKQIVTNESGLLSDEELLKRILNEIEKLGR
ncbi:MAG: formylmethanofuran dehydrogenase subunit B [Candidatus Odinarchaeia archaeon]